MDAHAQIIRGGTPPPPVRHFLSVSQELGGGGRADRVASQRPVVPGELGGKVNDAHDEDGTTVEPPAHAFDVRDNGNSAREITLAGVALRGTVEDPRRRLDDTVRPWILRGGAIAAGRRALAFALVLALRRIGQRHA